MDWYQTLSLMVKIITLGPCSLENACPLPKNEHYSNKSEGYQISELANLF